MLLAAIDARERAARTRNLVLRGALLIAGLVAWVCIAPPWLLIVNGIALLFVVLVLGCLWFCKWRLARFGVPTRRMR